MVRRETADALDLLLGRAHAFRHRIRKRADAIKAIRRRYIAQQALFDARRQIFREKADTLAHGYGSRAISRIMRAMTEKKAHFSALSVSPTQRRRNGRGRVRADGDGRRPERPARTIRRDPSVVYQAFGIARPPESLHFRTTGTLSGEQTQELLQYVDFAARRALMQRVSTPEKKALHSGYTRQQILALLDSQRHRRCNLGWRDSPRYVFMSSEIGPLKYIL
jgi:hypothetical protein